MLRRLKSDTLVTRVSHISGGSRIPRSRGRHKSRRGRELSRGGVNIRFGTIFRKNCMKLIIFWAVGTPPLDLPLHILHYLTNYWQPLPSPPPPPPDKKFSFSCSFLEILSPGPQTNLDKLLTGDVQ